MTVKTDVMDNSVLRGTPNELLTGQELKLDTSKDWIYDTTKGKWSDVEKIAKQVDQMDFPRRTHEEIIRDLHEMRG